MLDRPDGGVRAYVGIARARTPEFLRFPIQVLPQPEDLDDVLATIGTLGIDVLERQPKLPSSVLKRKFEEEVEPGGDLGLDLAPGAVEHIN